jgi:hypothetical protein
MARGERLETLQVVGQPIQQFVLKADGTVSGDGYNDANTHNDILFWEQRYDFF